MARMTGFDMATAPDQSEGSGDLLPEGEYVVAILKSEVRTQEKTHIDYLKCDIEVLSREWARKRLIIEIPFRMEHGYRDDSLSDGLLKHLNIGRGQIKALAQALIPADQAFTDSSQLHGKPVGMFMKIRDQEFDSNGKPYPLRNNLSRVLPANDVTSTPPAGTQASAPVSHKAAAAQQREAPPTPWSAPAPAAAPAAPPQQAPVAAPQFVQAAQVPAPVQQAGQQPVDQPQPPAAWAQVPQAPAAPSFVVPGQPPAQATQPQAAPVQAAPMSAATGATPPWLRG